MARRKRGIFLHRDVYYMKLKGPDGVWRQKSLGTKDYMEASQRFDETKAGQVVAIPERAPRFREYAEKHVAGLIARDRREWTIASVKDDLRKLNPHFGEKRLAGCGKMALKHEFHLRAPGEHVLEGPVVWG
jgi:hypothetical protein